MPRLSHLMNCWKCQRSFVQHYEPHNQSKCKRQVWRQVIYPEFAINYETMLRQLDADVYPLVKAGLIEEEEWRQISRKLAILNESDEWEEELAFAQPRLARNI